MCPNPMQNVMVISTSSHEHAVCYTAVENITVAEQQHEVNAYVAAPHATCKGVIRRIAIEDGPEPRLARPGRPPEPRARFKSPSPFVGGLSIVPEGVAARGLGWAQVSQRDKGRQQLPRPGAVAVQHQQPSPSAPPSPSGRWDCRRQQPRHVG
ncbi:hypothetical protein HPB49_007607 [Dermacentor silvarum]|uniref:Uncharacterized protein n=1 Tax=Dermacentor silvarum TaxID=543639 RepID=A0ACB8DN39_DERSI|nr:hypothetical protein HPB49_007607 [Dermacentor silvarum]